MAINIIQKYFIQMDDHVAFVLWIHRTYFYSVQFIELLSWPVWKDNLTGPFLYPAKRYQINKQIVSEYSKSQGIKKHSQTDGSVCLRGCPLQSSGSSFRVPCWPHTAVWILWDVHFSFQGSDYSVSVFADCISPFSRYYKDPRQGNLQRKEV